MVKKKKENKKFLFLIVITVAAITGVIILTLMLTESSSKNENQLYSNICVDSEENMTSMQEFAVKGNCIDKNGLHEDYCYDEIYIVDYYCAPTSSPREEQFCDGGRLFNCQAAGFNRCEDGACVN